MELNDDYRKKVEDNLRLVHKVINDKVRGPYQMGIYTREDLFQLGCIGLCKAAATDKGGSFSTYAYRLIWNQICDALIYSTRRLANEEAMDVSPYTASPDDRDLELNISLEQSLKKAKLETPPSTAKGIEAIILMAQGYTCREIGEQMGASTNSLLLGCPRLTNSSRQEKISLTLQARQTNRDAWDSSPASLLIWR